MNSEDPVRVAIAASSEAQCAELDALIADDTSMLIVGSAAFAELADLLERAHPEVLLLDLRSDAGQTPERIAERIALPSTVLLASAAFSGPDLLSPSVRAVLLRHPSPARLTAAIKAAAAGLMVFDEPSPTTGPPRQGPDTIEALTPREIQVLRLLGEGLPNKEIAALLAISEHTVKYHLVSIFGKLGATSRTEAVIIGIRRGLLMV